jgi:acyl-CoA synthetase (AMP-forming)/AMP-acid ligase II
MAASDKPAPGPAHPDDPRGDLTWGTTSRLLTMTAHRIPAVEAVVDGHLRLTYRELNAEVTRAARAFLAAGLDKGDRVAIWGPNSAGWLIAALGLQRAGGVLVPLNTRFKGAEAAYILAKSRSRLLLTVTDFLGNDYPAMLARAAGGHGTDRPIEELPALERIVLLPTDKDETADTSWTEFLAGGQAVSAAEAERRAAEVGPDDLADMLFTSGTTGNPKGAMCTHGQVLRAYAVWSNVVGLREGDRYLIVNPFFHGFGYKAGWLASIMAGATILPERTLDVPHVLDVVRRERVTVLPGTPTLYQTMLEHPDFSAEGVATLRLSVTGAANVPPALLYRIKQELGFEHIVTGYGLTETCGIVSMCRYDDSLETVATTAGRVLPGLELKVLASDGSSAPTGTEGEILVRGYALMEGYFGDEPETAATIDPDGWLHTGDIGVLDSEGRVRITDRMKDMFIVGGFNAYPAEIENVLTRHPGVAQAAVIGVPDERMGEIGAAYIVARAGHSPAPAEIISWSREYLANYKVPRHVEIVGELPLNAAGKVLKNVLRDRAAARVKSKRIKSG